MNKAKARTLASFLSDEERQQFMSDDRQMKARADAGLLTASQGLNDGRWFLLEHQLYQARVSLQQARSLCEQIGDNPENDEEWELARSALEIISPVYVRALAALAAFTSLMSGTKTARVVGRINQRKEKEQMSDQARFLTEEEIAACPSDSSVNVAIRRAGTWCYADGNPTEDDPSGLRNAMPILDEDGDYIPVE